MVDAVAVVSATSVAVSSSNSSASSIVSTISKTSSSALSSLASLPPSIHDVSNGITADAWVNGFATLIGALVGALVAYAFQLRIQRSLDTKNQLIAAHKLMFALLQQVNTILLIQRDYVYQELNNPGRFLSIPPTHPFDLQKNILKLEDLAFLLDTKQGRDVLYEFYLAQENYIEALNQWNGRSALHFQTVQPALAKSGLPNGGDVTEQDIRRALGEHTYGSIVNLTNNCIESLSRSFELLASAKKNCRNYLVVRFRTNDFADFDFPETYGLIRDLE